MHWPTILLGDPIYLFLFDPRQEENVHHYYCYYNDGSSTPKTRLLSEAMYT